MPLFQPGSLLELPIEHSPSVLLGPLGSGRSRYLRDRYKALLCWGVPAENVVLWVTNRNQAGVWRDYIRQFDFPHGETRVSTFRAWVRRELEMNWPLIEASGFLPGLPRLPEPFFMGSSAAQQVLREVTEPLRKRYPALERCRTPSFLQLIQVLDTYARLIENGFSPEQDEVIARLDRGHRLNADSPELHRFISESIAAYRAYCFAHRLLDYNAQLELFYRILWEIGDYRNRLKGEIAYLIVDNFEETIPANQAVIAELGKSCRGVLLAHDSNGGLREYLGGDPLGADELIRTIPESHHHAYTISQLVAPEMAAFADSLYQAVLNPPEADPPPSVPDALVTVHDPLTLRFQMFKVMERRLFALLEAGISPGEIVVIAPTVDQLLVYHLKKALAERNQLLRVLTGSNRVIDYRPVRTVLTFARLAAPIWDEAPSQQDVTEALECLLNLPPLDGSRLTRLVFDGSGLIAPPAITWKGQIQGVQAAYSALYEWVSQFRKTDVTLDWLLEDCFADLFAPRRLSTLKPDGSTVDGVPYSPDRVMPDDELDVLQIAHLIDNARAYRKLAHAMEIPAGDVARRFLKSIYAGELADTPLVPYNSLTEAVSLFTAAKYAEEGPPASYQIWVDAGSPYWFRSSIGELMNPMILSRNWRDGHYTDAHDRRHQSEKLARILRTVLLKATGTVDVYYSDYGSDGSELTGDLAYWLMELTARPLGGQP